ncbi:restriction endonuclease subunit S [Mycoplasma sp. CSL10166]|uniref:restriction endonuclease subunit S n=1 Tax=Mycoplasma sp. CSL10166 TaxID=2813825 RepID=UPI00197C2324|nr:restriction endonuclease subunit S [Mycoplasma sp. CSL10166]MBN4084126.1 restriction endonuclease subunit S [Mycoplasma sp. CSL10166]
MGDINGSTVDKVIRNEDIKCLMLNYMDVYNKKEIKKENLSFNSATPWQIYTNNILEGDVFITPSSETKYELGFAKTSNVEILNGVYSYHLIRFRPKNIKIERSYLDYLFDTQKYRTYFSINGQGAQRFTLSLSFFKNAIIYLPSLKEQERIIKLLKTLDSSIALLQRKLEKMKIIKEFLLNKMFVSGQAEFPEIRFKGFTNSWVQSPIETFVSKILKSNIFINDFKKTGNYPVYSATDIFGFINDNHLKEDAILISVDGSIGNLRIVNKNSWFISTNQAIIPNKNINIIFLFNILKRINFNKITIGTTIKHLYYSEYKNILIWSPKMNEQTKISKIFTNLDSSIALFQRKLEKLENIKKTLLNKMFI